MHWFFCMLIAVWGSATRPGIEEVVSRIWAGKKSEIMGPSDSNFAPTKFHMTGYEDDVSAEALTGTEIEAAVLKIASRGDLSNVEIAEKFKRIYAEYISASQVGRIRNRKFSRAATGRATDPWVGLSRERRRQLIGRIYCLMEEAVQRNGGRHADATTVKMIVSNQFKAETGLHATQTHLDQSFSTLRSVLV
jgi:hypothetical protein